MILNLKETVESPEHGVALPESHGWERRGRGMLVDCQAYLSSLSLVLSPSLLRTHCLPLFL